MKLNNVIKKISKRIQKKIDDYPRKRLNRMYVYTERQVSNIIISRILDDKPFLLGRFGNVELEVVRIVLEEKLTDEQLLQHNSVKLLSTFGGFYPVTIEALKLFASMYHTLMPEIDVLGSWCIDELYFKKELALSKKIMLSQIEPYLLSNPWSFALKGKKVLVVNPLVDTIKTQYLHRELLFKDPRVLPEFELSLFKPVYELNNDNHEYKSWFEAFEKMRNEILQIDFDIAILGCGAFGLPLASAIKKAGKKAVVMGGATQVLFGIRGKRWDDIPVFETLFNDYWVYPSETETPSGYKKLENGCYWK